MPVFYMYSVSVNYPKDYFANSRWISFLSGVFTLQHYYESHCRDPIYRCSLIHWYMVTWWGLCILHAVIWLPHLRIKSDVSASSDELIWAFLTLTLVTIVAGKVWDVYQHCAWQCILHQIHPSIHVATLWSITQSWYT